MSKNAGTLRRGASTILKKRGATERKEADGLHHEDTTELGVPVSYLQRLGCLNSLLQPTVLQETVTLVPEDQLKLTQKELDEDITRFVDIDPCAQHAVQTNHLIRAG